MQVIPLLAIQQVQRPAKESSLQQSDTLVDEQQSFPFLLHRNTQKIEEQAPFNEGQVQSEESNLSLITTQGENDLLANIQSIDLEVTEQSLVSTVPETREESILGIEELRITNAEHTNVATEVLHETVQSTFESQSNTTKLEIDQIMTELVVSQMVEHDQITQIVELMKAIDHVNDRQGTNLKDIASRLLPIIQQWSTFKHQIDEEKVTDVLKERLSKEQFNVWKLIESNVDKRSHYTQQYGQEAEISRADLIKWLQGALDRYTDNTTRVSPTFVSQHQAVPMTEVQQYTVHIQRLDRIDRVSEELTQKVVNIVKESRLLTTKQNGLQQMNQLTIVLRPEHLGNITVRFTQVDGNMTVQMVVTSQATKELLEANLHQLKHMFSPHQVVIERDDTISDDEFYREKNEEEQRDEESYEQTNESTSQEQNEDTETDFQRFIDQLIQGGLEDEQN